MIRYLARVCKRPCAALGPLRLVLLALAALGASSVACLGSGKPVTIAYSKFESSALLWVAVDQGYLDGHDVAVSLIQHSSGVGALDALLAGDADLAIGPSEFPLVGRAMEGADARTLACIAQSEYIYLVGRKDRGLASPADLRGKRIGVAMRTVAQFHVGRLLALRGIDEDEVTLVDLPTADSWVSAVAEGAVDVVVTAQPYARAAREALGGNAVFWPAQSHQPIYTQVIARAGWLDAHPQEARGLLEALAEAEDYVLDHPAEARAIVQKWLGVDAAYMDDVWAQNRFMLSLDQSLVLVMEDEARWMIANGLTSATEAPRLMDFIDEKGLRAVKPEAVKLIR